MEKQMDARMTSWGENSLLQMNLIISNENEVLKKTGQGQGNLNVPTESYCYQMRLYLTAIDFP